MKELRGRKRQPTQVVVLYAVDIELCTRPLPVDGAFAEASSNWVEMAVRDRGLNSVRLKQIAIETWPFLPEPKAVLSRPFTHCPCTEQLGLAIYQNLLDLLGKRLFDASQ